MEAASPLDDALVVRGVCPARPYSEGKGGPAFGIGRCRRIDAVDRPTHALEAYQAKGACEVRSMLQERGQGFVREFIEELGLPVVPRAVRYTCIEGTLEDLEGHGGDHRQDRFAPASDRFE